MTQSPRQSDQPAGGGFPPPPYPGAYPASHHYPPAPVLPRNGVGIAALSVAVLGLLASPSVLGGVVIGAVAVVLGFLGRARALRSEADNGGVAIAGVVLGFLSVVTGIAFAAIYFSLFSSAGGGRYLDCMQQVGSDPDGRQMCADQLRDRVGEKFGVTLVPEPSKGPTG